MHNFVDDELVWYVWWWYAKLQWQGLRYKRRIVRVESGHFHGDF